MRQFNMSTTSMFLSPLVSFLVLTSCISDHPLALYVFTQDKAFRDQIFGRTQSGAAIANEVLIHVAAEGLPFGGVGGSGCKSRCFVRPRM